MHLILRGAVVAVLMLCAACENRPAGNAKPGEATPPLPPDPGEAGIEAAPGEVVRATNTFGLALLRELSVPGSGNLVFSPAGLGMALSMAWNGADGSTSQAMRDALGHDTLSRVRANASWETLIESFGALPDSVMLEIANGAFYRSGIGLEEDFREVVTATWGADLLPLDLSAAEAAETVNAWVSAQTGGHIDSIVQGPLSDQLMLLLLNAVYFKAPWQEPFAPQRTRPGAFSLGDGERVEVPMMSHAGAVTVALHRTDDGITVFELPYADSALAMTVVLPAPDGDVHTVAAALTEPAWRDWTDALEDDRVAVRLPRYTTRTSLELRDALTALGMGVAFDPREADFGGMHEGMQDLHISRVTHAAMVEVSEAGTEASATTSVEMSVTSLPRTITVDRPFLFAIRDRASGLLLFLGLIGDPR